MALAVGSAAAGSGGVTGDAGAAVWGAVQLQPGVRAGGKRDLEVSAEMRMELAHFGRTSGSAGIEGLELNRLQLSVFRNRNTHGAL